MRTSLFVVAALTGTLQDPSPPAKDPDTIVHRCGDLRWQHGAYITSIAVLPGDKGALTSGYNGAVVLWDIESGRALQTYKGHTGEIFAMALFPDGKRFVTGGDDKKVMLWNLESAEPVRVFEGHKGLVRTVAVSSDGLRIVSSGHDSQIIVWDPENPKPVHAITSPLGSVVSLAIQPRGKLVLVDGSFKAGLCDLETGKWVKELTGSAKPDPRTHIGRRMEKVAFSADGRHAAAYFPYAGFTVWEVDSGKEIKSLGNKNWSYNSIAFTRDGRRALLGSQKSLEIWDFEKGEFIKSIGGAGFYAMAEMEKGAAILATPGDGSIALWDLDTGKRLSQVGTGEVFSVAYSPDGRSVLAGSRDGSIIQWDVASGRQIRTFEKLSPKKFGDGSPTQDWAASIVIAADGRTAVSGHWDGRTALWDLTNGKVLREYEGMFGGSVASVDLSPDGRWGVGSGAPAAIWELESGRAGRTFHPGPGAYTAAAFSPDGAFVLLGSNSQKLRLFDATTGAPVRHFEGHPGRVVALAFTPDGRHAVSGSESGEPPVLWDVATGKPVRKFPFPPGTPPSWGSALALSPDGAFLFTRGPQSELMVWDVESAKIVKSYGGHLHTVKAIAFSPGGRFVATGSQDTTVIVRHPGLPFKSRAQAWAAPMMKLDDDGKDFVDQCRRLFVGMKVADYDVWTETLERALALEERVVDRLIDAFPIPASGVPAERLAALLKELDQEDIEAREKARKNLSDLGESAYAWARDKARDATLSAAVRGALDSFRQEIERRPLKPLEANDLAELRAVLVLLELPDSEKRRKGIEHFARGAQNSVAARLARRHADYRRNR